MPINAVIDVIEDFPLYGYTEPVTLDEVKEYCKIDFNDEDDLLTRLITSSRETLEKYTGLSFVPKILTAILKNECGGIEIPYGPTPYPIDLTTVTDIYGNAWTASWIKIVGNQFKFLYDPISCYVQIMYSAGYISQAEYLTAGGGLIIPEDLRIAIMAQTFFRYQNRGEQLGYSATGVRSYSTLYVCDAAKEYCNRYKRNIELSL